MSNIRRRFMPVLGCLLGSFVLGLPYTAAAKESHRAIPAYSLESYNGDYAVIGTYGQNAARLIGTYYADGEGNISGTARVNLPGAGTARVVVSLSFAGSYTINEDGTGTIYFTVALPGGGTSVATLDFVITKAMVMDGVKVATEIADAQREPSSVVNGQFVTHMSTRRPKTRQRRDDF
jgi:hypothetical protein